MRAIAAGFLLLAGCSAPMYRLHRTGETLIVTPPATVRRMKMQLCNGPEKIAPAAILDRAGEILAAEDRGCIPPRTGVAYLEQAIQSHPVPARRAAEVRFSLSREQTHLDIMPGWRLRAITPILKSGRFRLSGTTQQSGNEITVRTDGDFLGMETSFYAVRDRDREPGVRIGLESVEAVIDGKPDVRQKPLALLFANLDRHVRLVYLVRRSESDHDMAVVSAPTRAELEDRARDVTTCEQMPGCQWVPAGIAVTAHMPVELDGAIRWAPAGSSVRDVLATREPPAHLTVLRKWRKKLLPIAGEPRDLWSLPLLADDRILIR